MITLPVLLIAVAVLLLLALLLGLFRQRRHTAPATLPGPRTVADLVQQRADREPASAPVPEPRSSAVDDVALVDEEPEPAAADGAGIGEAAVDEPSVDEPVADEPAVPVSAAGAAPVVVARAVAPLGDDVPWRRAAQMSGTDEPEPAAVGRVPALALLLRRPSRRPLPAESGHPFLPSGPRRPAIPVYGPPVDGSDDPAPVPAPADVDPAVAAPSVAAPSVAAPSVDANVVAEPVDVEPVGATSPAAAPLVDAMVRVDPVRAAPTDLVPAEGAPVGGDVPAAQRSAFPLAVAGLVAGAHSAGASADDVPDGDSPDGHAAGSAPEVVDASDGHTDEIHVSGVEPARDPSAVDLVPVDGGLPIAQDAPTAPAAGLVAPVAAAVVAGTRTPVTAEPDRLPSTDPDVLFDSPPVDPEPAPGSIASEPVDPDFADPESAAPATAAEPAVADALTLPDAAATPPPPATAHSAPDAPGTVEPLRRVPRDPEHVAAEQAAADLALLRTFGDPSARPERAPIVALEGTARPASPPPVGAPQLVRFRAVGRDGAAVDGAAVTLLDDRGREAGAAHSAGGELTAPYPGAYVLVATAPDHQPGAVALAVGDAPVDAEVLLVRSAALVGVVTGEDGLLAGARVTLVQDGEVVEVAETDADGAYLVADLASGEYAVSVAAAGCDPDVVLVVVPDETECVHDVELEPAGVRAG